MKEFVGFLIIVFLFGLSYPALAKENSATIPTQRFEPLEIFRESGVYPEMTMLPLGSFNEVPLVR